MFGYLFNCQQYFLSLPFWSCAAFAPSPQPHSMEGRRADGRDWVWGQCFVLSVSLPSWKRVVPNSFPHPQLCSERLWRDHKKDKPSSSLLGPFLLGASSHKVLSRCTVEFISLTFSDIHMQSLGNQTRNLHGDVCGGHTRSRCLELNHCRRTPPKADRVV